MTDLIRTRHKISGQIAEVPVEIVNHYVLGQYLEEVGPDAKPYLPEMHRVSLPADPTEDEIAVALSVGNITEDEAAELRKSASSTTDLEAERVAIEEANTKGKK